MLWTLWVACTKPAPTPEGDSGSTPVETPSGSGAPATGTPTEPTGDTGPTGGTAPTGDTGAPPDPCAGYAFCEDFEDGAAGQTPPGWSDYWGWDGSGSRAVLSDEQHHGGARSLKSAVGTNGQYRVSHPVDPALAQHHWGRVFYLVQTPVALDGQYVHNTFVAFGRPDSENGNESRLVDTVVDPTGAHQFLFNVPDDSCCASSSYDYRYEGGWHCAEWYVDGATESFRFYADGVEVGELAFDGVAGAHIAAFDEIVVGWINYQSPSTPNVGWFDDLALDDERIGCAELMRLRPTPSGKSRPGPGVVFGPIGTRFPAGPRHS
ncbi:MAG: hypothetical protein ABMB14_28365, partial [Myxococcota bacterium]